MFSLVLPACIAGDPALPDEGQPGTGPGFDSCPPIASNDDCGPVSAEADSHVVLPRVLHTGVDGNHLFQAVLVSDFGDFQLSSSDESIVCAARYSCIPPSGLGTSAVLTALGPGEATVTVTSGPVTESVTVKVADYTPAQWALGKQRYLTPVDENDSDRMACGDCHQGQGGAPHSPLHLAGHSDAHLLAATESSQFPGRCDNGDGMCNCEPTGTDCSACPEGDCTFSEGYTLSLERFGGEVGDHRFDLTAEERIGVMAYLRSLTPEGI